jgi:hypothetical protein
LKLLKKNKVPLILFSVFSAVAYVFLRYPECLVGDGKKIYILLGPNCGFTTAPGPVSKSHVLAKTF